MLNKKEHHQLTNAIKAMSSCNLSGSRYVHRDNVLVLINGYLESEEEAMKRATTMLDSFQKKHNLTDDDMVRLLNKLKIKKEV